MDCGKALRKLRTKAGMTQQALAEKVNVTAQAVSKWENGVNQPDIAMLSALCEVFRVSVDEFLALAKQEGEAVERAEEEQTANKAAKEQASEPQAEAAVAAVKKRSGDYPWYFVAGALALALLGFVLAAALVFGGLGRKPSAPGENLPSAQSGYTVTFFHDSDVVATRTVEKGK